MLDKIKEIIIIVIMSFIADYKNSLLKINLFMKTILIDNNKRLKTQNISPI